MTIFSSANPGAYRYPFPAFPDGWFAIAFSEDLKPGQLLSLHRLGRDIVLYRTEQGQAIAVDAYCPHVGAHLGEGRVLGEELQCAFHHWRYGPDGRCAHAPRAKRTPAVSLDGYPLQERNSLLFIWVHATGAAPDYEIDPIPELENGDYRQVRRHDWLVRSHPQEMMENSVDVTHFEAVHRWRAKSIDWQCEGPRYWMRIAVDNQGEGYQSATAANADDVVSTNVGPGFSYTRFTGSLNAISLNIMTPTEAGMVWNPQSFWVAPAIDEAMAQGWTQGFLDDYADDIPIWESKIYREKPALSDADGAFARYRRWYGQFYTDRTPGA